MFLKQDKYIPEDYETETNKWKAKNPRVESQQAGRVLSWVFSGVGGWQDLVWGPAGH